jgi:hypothetical protein
VRYNTITNHFLEINTRYQTYSEQTKPISYLKIIFENLSEEILPISIVEDKYYVEYQNNSPEPKIITRLELLYNTSETNYTYANINYIIDPFKNVQIFWNISWQKNPSSGITNIFLTNLKSYFRQIQTSYPLTNILVRLNVNGNIYEFNEPAILEEITSNYTLWKAIFKNDQESGILNFVKGFNNNFSLVEKNTNIQWEKDEIKIIKIKIYWNAFEDPPNIQPQRIDLSDYFLGNDEIIITGPPIRELTFRINLQPEPSVKSSQLRFFNSLIRIIWENWLESFTRIILSKVKIGINFNRFLIIQRIRSYLTKTRVNIYKRFSALRDYLMMIGLNIFRRFSQNRNYLVWLNYSRRFFSFIPRQNQVLIKMLLERKKAEFTDNWKKLDIDKL